MRLAAPGRALAPVVLACALAWINARADDANAPAVLVFHGAARQLTVPIPRVEHGPVIDGRLDDAVWQQAAVLDSFVQSSPVEGVRDTLGTRCLVLYDQRAIYVAFHCNDRARDLRAPLVGRDHADEGDFVGINLDTYLDRRRSVVLCVSPRGVQFDGVEQDETGFDPAPDFHYRGEGRVLGDGYEVEIAVPFRSLRFPHRDTLAFGFEAGRYIQRNNALTYWAPRTADIPSVNSQHGTLAGFTGITPGRNLEVIPTFTSLTAATGSTPPLTFGDPAARAGADVKYGLTTNVLASATVNPDFSQVEADAGVVDINQRFAIFFPEKRPFFLEGTDLFQTPLQLMYTRRIVDPRYGVKLTGKAGGTAIGVMNAADRSAGAADDTIPDAENRYLGHDANNTVVRLKQDVGKNDYVGLLLENREQLDAYNRLGGVDGHWIVWKDWVLSGQGALSTVRDRSAPFTYFVPDTTGDTVRTGTEPGATRSGYAWTGNLTHDVRRVTTSFFVEDYSPDFTADLGFIPRLDVINLGGRFQPHLYGDEQAKFQKFNYGVNYTRTLDHGEENHFGRLLDELLEVEINATLRSNSEVGLGVRRIYTFNDGQAFPDQWRGYAFIDISQYAFVQATGNASYGDNVIFEENASGRSLDLALSATIRPAPPTKIEGSLLGNLIWRSTDGSRYADAMIPRVRLDQQFTRELALRGIAELHSDRTFDPAGTLVSSSRAVVLDVLLSYLLEPGSVIYLGYGSGLDGESLTGVRPTRAQVFFKASWSFQL